MSSFTLRLWEALGGLPTEPPPLGLTHSALGGVLQPKGPCKAQVENVMYSCMDSDTQQVSLTGLTALLKNRVTCVRPVRETMSGVISPGLRSY